MEKKEFINKWNTEVEVNLNKYAELPDGLTNIQLYCTGYNSARKEILEDLKKLDEQKKVVVPKFVADWFEENKEDLESAINTHCLKLVTCDKTADFYKWFINNGNRAIITLAKMLYGYEVETTTHVLKIQQNYFNAVKSGKKKFEIRKNDRNYKVGDILLLKEYTCGSYTDNEYRAKITYITDYAQKDNYVVLSIEEEK